ncbi:unnamed protein product, partial [Iphiclides podalirius]
MINISKIFINPVLLYILFNIALLSDGKFYRFDYKYHQEIQGWLKFHRVPATWHDARLQCQLEGAVLASPLNDDLLAAMNHTTYNIFIGIHATIAKGYYFSLEGVPLTRIPITWAAGEPDNCDNSEECLVLKNDGTVADVNCNEVFPFICYKKSKNTSFITNCGTGDSGYTLNENTGNCYKFHDVGRTWPVAFMTCSAEGGYLAIINSDQEAQSLKELFAHYPDTKIKARYPYVALLGFYDWNRLGTWNTIHGETLAEAGYSRWNKGQPDNATDGQYCGAMFREGLFDDMWCHLTAPFICEKEPQSLLDDDDVY